MSGVGMTDPQLSPQVLAGRTFRMMREAHRVTGQELAGIVGISPSHLSRVETGTRKASAELSERLCDVIANLPPVRRRA